MDSYETNIPESGKEKKKKMKEDSPSVLTTSPDNGSLVSQCNTEDGKPKKKKMKEAMTSAEKNKLIDNYEPDSNELVELSIKMLDSYVTKKIGKEVLV